MTPLFVTIDGVQKELTSLPGMVDGVQREMSSLLATVDGVAREVFSAGVSGKALSSYSTGDIVYLNEGDIPTAFYVIKHNYEPDLNTNRTLLARKDPLHKMEWYISGTLKKFPRSNMNAYMNADYIYVFSEYVRNLIGKTTIRITDLDPVQLATAEMAFFLVSVAETRSSYPSNYEAEGSLLLEDIAMLYSLLNVEEGQWTRSPDTATTTNAAMLGFDFYPQSIKGTTRCWFRPMCTLPANTLFDPATHILLETESGQPSDPPIDDLPSGYAKVNYIQSSTTAYFNTGYVPTHNTRVVLKCKILEVTANGWVFGSRTSSQANQFDLFCETGGTSWRVGIGNKQTMISAGTFLGEYTFDISKDGAYVNGVKTDVTYGEFTGAQPIYLCGGNNGGNFFTGGHIIQQVEECQIYESGVLVHDYAPCMNMSGVYGLYDKNTGEFGGSSGTGAFTGG